MIDFIEYMKKELEINDIDIRTYSPLVLAYIGDAVYEVIIRTKIVSKGNAPVNKLHNQSSQLVKAQTQAAIMKAIEHILTEEELKIYKRGRNAKSTTSAKNATVGEYRIATGFEALIGYLYLQEEYVRIIDIVKKGLLVLEDKS